MLSGWMGHPCLFRTGIHCGSTSQTFPPTAKGRREKDWEEVSSMNEGGGGAEEEAPGTQPRSPEPHLCSPQVERRQASCLLASQRNHGIKLAGGDGVVNREGGLGLQYDHIDLKMPLFLKICFY